METQIHSALIYLIKTGNYNSDEGYSLLGVRSLMSSGVLLLQIGHKYHCNCRGRRHLKLLLVGAYYRR